MAAEARFRAMGSDAHVIVVGGAFDLATHARRRIDDLERRWSRFLPDSEVSAINQAAGAAVAVSPETALLVRRAFAAWRITGGLFDPTVLGAVIRAGYDRSFDDVAAAPRDGRSDLAPGASGIEVTDGTVRLPAGTGFDPGGIGKGLAADIVVAELRAAGASGACVNLGGDVRMTGVAPDGGDWTVAVQHPLANAPLTHVGLRDGAVATSTTLRRRWRVDGATRHHLIDPATGRPSATRITFATVVAGEAWAAEVLAKAIMLRGRPRHFDVLGRTGAEAIVVDDQGACDASFGFRTYTEAAA
jgi:thiamine biosynthesis lipoprotein